MGVTGLLPFLKKCSRPVSIKDFKGYTVAVDAYCWIHRASYSCAMDLALGNPTTQYVTYCLKYLNMVLDAGVRPILVFDGANLPAKAETESKRRKSKKMYKERAAQYLLEGNRKAAHECFERCVDVTPEMARTVMKAARDLGVDCIIAPYESDAQLAYLTQAGYADLVITEDSDLLLFGCKQVLFKLDLTGWGVLIAWSSGIGEQCCGIATQDFVPANLRFMGILSGCDYFPGIPRIGLATAAKILRQCRTTDFRYLLSNLGSYCNLCEAACKPITYLDDSGAQGYKENDLTLTPSSSLSNLQATPSSSLKKRSSVARFQSGGINKLHEDTIRAAIRAERTFRLQVVFDPKNRKRLRLSEPTMEDVQEEKLRLLDSELPESELFAYAGDDSMDEEMAFSIAVGNVDFENGKTVDSFNPEDFMVRKLYGGLRPNSDLLDFFKTQRNGSPLKSVLKKVVRPDGDRLNVSIWSSDYKLEPVWLYYTGTGARSRPYCVSVKSGCDVDSAAHQLSAVDNSGGSARPPAPRSTKPPTTPSRPSLGGGTEGLGMNRSRWVTVPFSILTAEPALSVRKRSLCETEEQNIQDLIASYGVNDGAALPKTPKRLCLADETPVTSAGSYFATPVSTLFHEDKVEIDQPKSPVFKSKRLLSVFTEVDSVSESLGDDGSPVPPSRVNVFASLNSQELRPKLSTHTSLNTGNSVMSQYLKISPSFQRLWPAPISAAKCDTRSPAPARHSLSDVRNDPEPNYEIIDLDRPASPIFTDHTITQTDIPAETLPDNVNEPVASKRQDLSSFFGKWQFNPTKRKPHQPS